MLRQSDYEEFRDSINSLIEEYREKFSIPHVMDWKEYEKKYRSRLTGASRELRSLLLEASSRIRDDEFGRPSIIHAVDRAQIILSKEMFSLSNRKTAYLMPLMGLDYEVSYKTIERICSDDIVSMIMHNLFVLSVKKRGIAISNACGDGTGYSLTVSDHYRSVREKLGESVKHGKYRYSFALMDLRTRMYIGYASSVRSERDAYQKALRMISGLGIQINSVRLDKYYSGQSILDDSSENTRIFIIPKKNSRIRGKKGWRDIIASFMNDPMEFLKEYFKPNNSEAGFSSDKRATGWRIFQRRDDRIETSIFIKGLWHNLMLMNG